MAIDINSILTTLEGKIVTLATTTFTDFKDEAVSDGKQLLATVKDDLTTRTQLLADSKITPAEFGVLMLGDSDLVEMDALTQAGLALAKIDAFKQSVFQLITDTVTALIP